MKHPLTTSKAGVALICKFEGCYLEAYLCPAGIPTIGYGHTKDVKLGDKITAEEAVQLLHADLQEFEAGVSNLVTVELNQAQFDALVSFAFNLGLGNLKKSTLLVKVNQHNFVDAAREFHRWAMAGGKRLPGLVARRQAEVWMFLS